MFILRIRLGRCLTALLLCLVFMTPISWAQEFAGGDGTSDAPFQIETWYHLHDIRFHLEAHFILINDLGPGTPGYTTFIRGERFLSNNRRGWNPIGCVLKDLGESMSRIECSPFNGVLDGNHHQIQGLEIARGFQSEAGVFGRVGENGTIRNLRMFGLKVTGREVTGGVVGVNDGTLSGLRVQGEVVGANRSTGGVVGSNSGTLSDVSFYGSVTGEADTGGLVGRAGSTSSSVSASYADAVVRGTTRVGGTIGINFGVVNQVFARGAVSGEANVGGLIGSTFRDLNETYSSASVSASNGVAGGLLGRLDNTLSKITIRNSYATGTVSGNSDSRGLVGNAPRTPDSGPFAVTNSFWDVERSGLGSVGPDDMGAIGQTTAAMKSKTTFADAGWDFGARWHMIEGVTLPQLQAISYASGDGSSASPYQISTWWHLENIGLNLDANFVLINDLGPDTPGYTTLVKDGATLANDGKGWQPIGSIDADHPFDNAFTGEFDGNQHTISGLEIQRSAERHVGLFSVLEGGLIKDLRLLNVSVEGDTNTGGLVGLAHLTSATLSNIEVSGQVISSSNRIGCLAGQSGATITDAHVDCTVQGGSRVGGLVGDNRGEIARSSSSGVVTGQSSSVGGLVGHNSEAVEQSFSRSSVTGSESVGGLIGSNENARIRNTYAVGTVTGTQSVSETVAGLIGSNGSQDGPAAGDVQNSYSAGSINGAGSDRAFIGVSNSSDGPVDYSNNFFDSEVSGQSAATDSSATAGTTLQMKAMATFTEAGWDFSDSGPWAMLQGINRSYPYLRAIGYDSPETTDPSRPIPGIQASTAPTAPRSLAASVGNAQVTVSWEAPSDSGGAVITGYTVVGIPSGYCAVAGDVTECTITGLTNGTEYAFVVIAANDLGNSLPSAASEAVTPQGRRLLSRPPPVAPDQAVPVPVNSPWLLWLLVMVLMWVALRRLGHCRP